MTTHNSKMCCLKLARAYLSHSTGSFQLTNIFNHRQSGATLTAVTHIRPLSTISQRRLNSTSPFRDTLKGQQQQQQQHVTTISSGVSCGQQRTISTNSGPAGSYSRWQANNNNNTTSGEQSSSQNAFDKSYNTILVTRPRKHIASIELNRPKAKNAFGLDTADEFLHLFNDLEADQSIRCAILSGNGPDFTSGVDLKSFMGVYSKLQQTEDVAHRAKLLRQVVEQFQAPFKRMYSFSKPIICISHGLSLGLGIELAACSDIRFCTQDVRLAIREVLIGIAADVGSLQLLPRLVANQSLLHELLFTGRYLTPDEALSLGFVSRICPSKAQAMEEALQLAQMIAERSPVAIQGSKQNLRFSCDKPFLVGLDYNAIWNGAMMQGNDVVKAIGAILSKTDQVDYDDF